MIIKVYLSNIAMGCSIEQQQELMALRVPGWPHVPTYRDVLSPAKRKVHAAASLVQRNELLRETGRTEGTETIFVGSLACLAWEQSDFLACIAIASRRRATLVALDTGRRIAPDASPSEIAEATREFLARRKSKRGLGPVGYQVSADRRSNAAHAAAMRIKDRWALPNKDYPTKALLNEAGICRNTAKQYLGKRKEVQRVYRNGLAQAERNRKRRVRVEQLQKEAA